MNKISRKTRQQIADEIGLAKIVYHGRLEEPDFLNRLFDLRAMPSRDPRYSNAYEDIHKHMVMNNDWSDNWIFSDPRFNLMSCNDEQFLRFLAETLHPLVFSHKGEKLLELYNKILNGSGYEIIQIDEIQGQPIYQGVEKSLGFAALNASRQEVKKFLTGEYIDQKIKLMNDSVDSNTPLAIGTAKELVETVCKSILKKNGLAVDKDWEVARLLKETTNALDFKPKDADEPEKAERSIKQILGGIASAIQGVAELRNSYGSGHGKDADFVGLETRFARLIVGLVSNVAIFYLSTNGSKVELVE